MDIGIENIQEEPFSKDIKKSQQMKNENPFDNINLSKTEMIADNQDTPKIENNNQNNLFDANPTIISINDLTKTQNIFPEEMTETQVVTSNIQQQSDNVVNSFGNSTKNQNDFEANNYLGNTGLNKGSITNYTMNNSNQNIIQGSQQFPLIDSQQIYGNENNEQQDFVKSHKIYESIHEQIVKYKIPKPDENILNYNQEHISPEEPESQNFVEKKNDVLITENEVKQVQNQLKSLKVSKTKYLSEEEVNNFINNDEIAENNLNNNNKEETNQFTYIQNPIDEKDNIYRTNFIDTNIEETNFANNEEKNIITSNILGNDELIKVSEMKYVQNDTNLNNQEDNQVPIQEKKYNNNTKVLKIEDEENVHFCPDYISNFLKKIFG